MKALITVGDQKYSVPETLTVEQFAAIQSFGFDNARATKLICATVLSAPLNAFNDVEDEDLQLLLGMCLTPLVNLETAVDIEIPGYQPLDMTQLTFGQFVDLDVISHRGLKTNLSELISVLWTMPIEEVLEKPIDWFWSRVEEWLAFRSKLYNTYATFFDIDENNAQVDGGDAEATDAARVWYSAIIALAGEDFLKINLVADRPVIEAMNFLSYLKDKRFREQQNQKRQMAINKRK